MNMVMTVIALRPFGIAPTKRKGRLMRCEAQIFDRSIQIL
jgi:hypothetical protein